MVKKKILPFLIRVLGILAILSIVFPMLEINVAGIQCTPTLVGISDISSFFQSMDIDRVFGSLNIIPFIENVKISLPILGEASLSEVLLAISDGTLGSLIGPVGGSGGNVAIFYSIQTIASALYIASFLCVLFVERRWQFQKGMLSLLFAITYIVIYIWISRMVSGVDFLQNATFRKVFSVSEDGFLSVGIGTYLYMIGMTGHALLLMARALCDKPTAANVRGGVRI